MPILELTSVSSLDHSLRSVNENLYATVSYTTCLCCVVSYRNIATETKDVLDTSASNTLTCEALCYRESTLLRKSLVLCCVTV